MWMPGPKSCTSFVCFSRCSNWELNQKWNSGIQTGTHLEFQCLRQRLSLLQQNASPWILFFNWQKMCVVLRIVSCTCTFLSFCGQITLGWQLDQLGLGHKNSYWKFLLCMVLCNNMQFLDDKLVEGSGGEWHHSPSRTELCTDWSSRVSVTQLGLDGFMKT